jgi:hypothetical protein
LVNLPADGTPHELYKYRLLALPTTVKSLINPIELSGILPAVGACHVPLSHKNKPVGVG